MNKESGFLLFNYRFYKSLTVFYSWNEIKAKRMIKGGILRTFVLFLSALMLLSCSARENERIIEYTEVNSIEKKLQPYGLPLTVRFPVEDEVIGSYKIQVKNDLDGFIWHLKKGEGFQFLIEELGGDEQLFDDKINAMLSVDFFSSALEKRAPDFFVFHLNEGEENEFYYIMRKIKVNDIFFMISTLEEGVALEYFERMQQTILSVKEN